MARKINYKNLDKLLTRIVIIVSTFSLIYFVYLSTQDARVNTFYLERIKTCDIGHVQCLDIWHKYLDDFRSAQVWSGIIGVGLPIIYFSGKTLLNYIAPEKEI